MSNSEEKRYYADEVDFYLNRFHEGKLKHDCYEVIMTFERASVVDVQTDGKVKQIKVRKSFIYRSLATGKEIEKKVRVNKFLGILDVENQKYI